MNVKNWVVVANASRARLLESVGPPGGFRHIADMVHPQSRQKGTELARDRPGRIEGTGHGLGSAKYLPKTDAREREHERFAQEVAQALNEGVSDGRCGGIVLVASNPFLGQLRAHLGTRAEKLLLRTLAHDYTALTEAELTARLSA
jgi:protein required for attachment to host cells